MNSSKQVAHARQCLRQGLLVHPRPIPFIRWSATSW